MRGDACGHIAQHDQVAHFGVMSSVAGDEPFMRDNVVVDKDDDFTNRRLDAGLLCQGLPDALTMKDRLETRLALGDLLQILERAIPDSRRPRRALPLSIGEDRIQNTREEGAPEVRRDDDLVSRRYSCRRRVHQSAKLAQ